MFRLQIHLRSSLSVAAALLPLLCAGCGSSSSSNTLTQPQAQAVSQQVSVALDSALTASFSSDALAARGLHPSLPHPGLATALGVLHPDSSGPCTSTDTGENCDWPVSYSSSCTGGGTISVAGDIDGTLDSSGGGSIQTALTITPANCAVSGLVLNGDPNVTVAGQVAFAQSALVYPITFTETGAISYGSKSFEVCQVNVTDTVSSPTACTITGTVCGQSVSGSC